jgi:hypothetical protein
MSSSSSLALGGTTEALLMEAHQSTETSLNNSFYASAPLESQAVSGPTGTKTKGAASKAGGVKTKALTSAASLKLQMSAFTAQLQKLQQDVSYLNGIGMDLYELGKLKTSALHFHHALQQMKAVSRVKRQIKKLAGAKYNPPNLTVKELARSASLVKKACQPLLIDTVCPATSLHWETVASLALMHNAALVHLKGDKLAQAKQMLDLALNLLKKEMQESDLHKLLDVSKYSVSVVISLYISLGRVMSQMPDAEAAQVKQVFQIASNLMERFVDQNGGPKKAQPKPKAVKRKAPAPVSKPVKKRAAPQKMMMAPGDPSMASMTKAAHMLEEDSGVSLPPLPTNMMGHGMRPDSSSSSHQSGGFGPMGMGPMGGYHPGMNMGAMGMMGMGGMGMGMNMNGFNPSMMQANLNMMQQQANAYGFGNGAGGAPATGSSSSSNGRNFGNSAM